MTDDLHADLDDAITGQTVLVTEPVFTPEQIKADGRSRVLNTGGQVGLAVPIVGLVSAGLRNKGWMHGDLDSLAFGYWTAITTTFLSALSNIAKFRGRG